MDAKETPRSQAYSLTIAPAIILPSLKTDGYRRRFLGQDWAGPLMPSQAFDGPKTNTDDDSMNRFRIRPASRMHQVPRRR